VAVAFGPVLGKFARVVRGSSKTGEALTMVAKEEDRSAKAASGGATAARVLVVEDTPEFRQLIVPPLSAEGFSVETAEDGEQALERARSFQPDVVVLDLGLPRLDGIEVCRQLRNFSDAWIIMLTARDEEVDKLVGLSIGADDYMTKPFSSRELITRIRAKLRRARAPAPPALARRFGDLVIDPVAREVKVRGEIVEVTRVEFELLDLLSANPRVVFSRERMLDRLWGPGWYGDPHVLDVHISNLRRKLGEDPRNPHYIRTVRGVGFRIGEAGSAL
jgi:DNA-binding response OmpR family regulator